MAPSLAMRRRVLAHGAALHAKPAGAEVRLLSYSPSVFQQELHALEMEELAIIQEALLILDGCFDSCFDRLRGPLSLSLANAP